jgi:hypothetical protein
MTDGRRADIKALFFDVFGTLVDWRESVAREAKAVLEQLGHKTDWLAFADAWRGEYQPAMDEVRSGRIPFSKLDVLHRRNLERILPRFGILHLDDKTMAHHNGAWHRLDAWPDVASTGSGEVFSSRRYRTATSRSWSISRAATAFPGMRFSVPRLPATTNRSRGFILQPRRPSTSRLPPA